MSMPFYVSPDQVMADKAEFSRKGIARGKSSLVIECDIGIVMMAENPSSLQKIGEIYDRLAFHMPSEDVEDGVFDQVRKWTCHFVVGRAPACSSATCSCNNTHPQSHSRLSPTVKPHHPERPHT